MSKVLPKNFTAPNACAKEREKLTPMCDTWIFRGKRQLSFTHATLQYNDIIDRLFCCTSSLAPIFQISHNYISQIGIGGAEARIVLNLNCASVCSALEEVEKTRSFLFIEHANFSIKLDLCEAAIVSCFCVVRSFFFHADIKPLWQTRKTIHHLFKQFFAHNRVQGENVFNKWPLLVITIDTHRHLFTQFNQLTSTESVMRCACARAVPPSDRILHFFDFIYLGEKQTQCIFFNASCFQLCY